MVDEEELRVVWNAARAAAATEACAQDAALTVLAEAARRRGCGVDVDRDEIVARAVLLAVRTDPCEAYAALPGPEREALALARLARCGVADIAHLCRRPAADVRGALTNGLRRRSTAWA